jgi:hypothetical protein
METKKMETIFGVIFTIVAVVILYSSLGQKDEMKTKREKELKEYPDIENVFTEYKGIVINSHLSKGMVGAKSITLNNGQKFLVSSDTWNRKYKKGAMMEFIQIGDSIYKPANSDSIFIYRGNKTYYFLLGRSIGK